VCKATWAKRAENILEADVFATLDQGGVGRLIRMGVEKGRSTRPTLKIGICGEHAGDRSRSSSAHTIGLDYVSCSRTCTHRAPGSRPGGSQGEEAGKGWEEIAVNRTNS